MNLPKEIIHLILEYDGKIKYRNGKYIDQVNTSQNKYKKLFQTIKNKYFYQKKINNFREKFYVDILLFNNNNIKLGIIFDYYYYGNEYMISFYKDIGHSFYYQFTDIFYYYFRINHPDYFIINYCYV